MFSNRRTSAYLSVALLAAFVLRATIPIGYMPSAVADGLPFVLCPDNLPASFAALVEGPGHHHDHGTDDANVVDQCDFGDLISAAAVPGDVQVAAPEPQATIYHIPESRAYIQRNLLRAFARGPPA
jgi:hypothetical protein